MPLYEVIVDHESITYEIEAKNEEEATRIAVEKNGLSRTVDVCNTCVDLKEPEIIEIKAIEISDDNWGRKRNHEHIEQFNLCRC